MELMKEEEEEGKKWERERERERELIAKDQMMVAARQVKLV